MRLSEIGIRVLGASSARLISMHAVESCLGCGRGADVAAGFRGPPGWCVARFVLLDVEAVWLLQEILELWLPSLGADGLECGFVGLEVRARGFLRGPAPCGSASDRTSGQRHERGMRLRWGRLAGLALECPGSLACFRRSRAA